MNFRHWPPRDRSTGILINFISPLSPAPLPRRSGLFSALPTRTARALAAPPRAPGCPTQPKWLGSAEREAHRSARLPPSAMGFLDDVFDECREELQITPRAKTPQPRKKRKPRAAAPRRDARVHVAPAATPPRVAPAAEAPPPSVIEPPLPRSPSPLRRRGNKIPTSPSKIPRDGTSADTELVKHANRLASVAASLDSLDLEALARAHQGQGASGITAAAAAAAALNSAIACAVSGEGPEQVRRKLERRSRAVQRS